MARAAGDISLKWVAAQEYTISGYQNLAHAAYAVGNELDLSALDNVVDVLVGSKHKTASARSRPIRSSSSTRWRRSTAPTIPRPR